MQKAGSSSVPFLRMEAFIKFCMLLLAVSKHGVVGEISGNSSSGNQNDTSAGASVDSRDPSKYDHIIIRGLPYARGLSYGQQAREKILRSLNYYKNSANLPPWAECIEFTRENYLPAIKKYYPDGLNEMEGIADGAGVTLEDVLILNSRYDLSRVQRARRIKNSLKKSHEEASKNDIGHFNSSRTKTTTKGATLDLDTGTTASTSTVDECTGAVALKSATKLDHVLLGQNWDINRRIFDQDLAILLQVYPDPSENISPFITLTEAGQLGRSGMNKDGLGIIGMSLWSSNEIYERDPKLHPNGWMPVTLLRRMFLEAPNFSMGLRAILQSPRHVASSIIIATAEDESLSLELVPDQYFVQTAPLGQEFMSHSNHFKSAGFQGRDDVREGSRGSSSLFRDRRVAKSLFGAWPNITEETFQTAFKDHVGYPNSVCEHAVDQNQDPKLMRTSAFPSEMTVASVIYNLSQKTLQLCKGPPCSGIFMNYTL